MTITVNVENANLRELLARVEAGEEVVLLRGDEPVAKLSGDRRSYEQGRAYRDHHPRTGRTAARHPRRDRRVETDRPEVTSVNRRLAEAAMREGVEPPYIASPPAPKP